VLYQLSYSHRHVDYTTAVRRCQKRVVLLSRSSSLLAFSCEHKNKTFNECDMKFLFVVELKAKG
jgi:hypothetical protein